MKREEGESFNDYKLRRKLNRILMDRELAGWYTINGKRVYAADNYYRIKWNKLVKEAKHEIQM